MLELLNAYEVLVDQQLATVTAAADLPLAQLDQARALGRLVDGADI